MLRESNPGSDVTFSACPEQPRRSPCLLNNGYCVFLGGKPAGTWCWKTNPSSTKVANGLVVYLRLLSVSALACHGVRFLPFPWLTSWSTVLSEQLTASQLVKKVLEFCQTRKFITAFSIFRLLSLFCASSFQSNNQHSTFWSSIILHSPLYTYFFKCLRFPHQTLYASLLCSITATFPVHLIIHDLIIRIIFWEQYGSLSSSLFNLLHSPVTCIPLRPKYPFHRPILEDPQTMFLPHCRRPIFAPI